LPSGLLIAGILSLLSICPANINWMLTVSQAKCSMLGEKEGDVEEKHTCPLSQFHQRVRDREIMSRGRGRGRSRLRTEQGV